LSVPPRLVIFDCDGVLVDSETISNRVLARMLREQGLELTTEQARARYQGLLLADIAAHVEGDLGRSLPDDWGERFEAERERAFRAELREVPHAREAVEGVRAAGASVCVASQGRLRKTTLSLELTGLRELFADDALFSAEAVARGKPYPDLFLHAAEALGVPAASAAVVEDSPSGVRAAGAAGMRALGYTADSDAGALAQAGAELIDSMALVPARLGLA
jgi:HAD superfamily hydrolase (TIGR01509 family)